MRLKSILATLVASATLIAATAATAAPYKLVGSYQRSSSGTLSSLMFKAGAAQGCPGPTYTQPCFNPAGPSPGGAWTATNGVATEIIAAGQPTWDWNGSTLTATGLFWQAGAISSNPNGTIVIGDRFTNFTITPGTTTTTGATYECREGTFLESVNANGCLNIDQGADFTDNSSAVYNVGASANCVNRTVGGDDVDTGPPRGLFTAVAGGGCDAVDGSIDFYNVVPNPRFLILATAPAIVVNAGDCYMFGRNGLTPGPSPCAADIALAGVSYLILAPDVDTDSDGVVDALDNCIAKSNANQADSDGDGYGNRCDGDLNNNGATNAQDTSMFRPRLGMAVPGPVFDKADFNANGIVNAQDTSIFRTLLGAGPGPSGLCVNSSNVPVFPCPANP